jgi:hypothetical protein
LTLRPSPTNLPLVSQPDSAPLGRSPYVWMVLVGAPTAYLYWALATLSVEGFRNLSGAKGESGTRAFLVALMALPLLAWGTCFAVMQGRRFPRLICAALYATALVLPLTLIALCTRLAMTGGF